MVEPRKEYIEWGSLYSEEKHCIFSSSEIPSSNSLDINVATTPLKFQQLLITE